jgi:hypothetical protein
LEQCNEQDEDRQERLARRGRRTRALRGEVGKGLVKLPVYEIEKQVPLSGAVG